MENSAKASLKKIALIGNPNVGKSSIFNQLTGLNQKIGNYPGITVDKSIGSITIKDKAFELIDLPGTYSLYPKSEDEVIAYRVLNGLEAEKPDYVLVVLDATNMERSLLLGTQVMDLGIPMAFVVNMIDLAKNKGLEIRSFELYKQLHVPIVLTDARKNEGMESIRDLIFQEKFSKPSGFISLDEVLDQSFLEDIQKITGLKTGYQAFQALVFSQRDKRLSQEDKKRWKEQVEKHGIDLDSLQVKETGIRYRKIGEVLSTSLVKDNLTLKSFTQALDKWMIHPVLGYFVFFGILLLVFQAVFAWAETPMDLIDGAFAGLGTWVSETLPPGVFTDLLAEGIIPGIGGVVIFIPQIALLFGFLAFLEDTGYMSRVVFLMDRIMKPFGLHGKSVVPLISGMACAIPGIMATRSISNTKERLITIMVTPWMSCSARLPVYIILIGLTVPDEPLFGFSMQAVALMGMYLLGIVVTLVGALILNRLMSSEEKSYLMIELPIYRFPRWKAVLLTMFSKSKTFVLEAGKVILSISIVLWVLASYGPAERREALEEQKALLLEQSPEEDWEMIEVEFESKKLETSYIGILGKSIEPMIKPLGYDWKIGIALLTSFAAREVFVATIATIYSIGGDAEDELTIKEKLSKETDPLTGEKVFNRATGFSLMVFYALAMQCMSTLAVVYRETKTWKWPALQTVVMTVVAYLAALITYNLFS